MGGRVGCHVALEESVRGVVCLGYPLLGTSKSAPMRDQVLLDLEAPTLFIQGTRDKLCPLPLLHEVLARRQATSLVHVVETGDHSLLATKTHLKTKQTTQADVEKVALAQIAQFCFDRST